MARQSRLQLIAIVTILLSLLITPVNNAQGVTEEVVKEARVVIMWGDTEDTIAPTEETAMWDGYITMGGPNITLLRPLWFKDEHDGVHELEGSEISFNSDISSDYDGLYIRVNPSPNTQTLFFHREDGTTFSFDLRELIASDVTELTVEAEDGYSVKVTEQFLSTVHVDYDSGEETEGSTTDNISYETTSTDKVEVNPIRYEGAYSFLGEDRPREEQLEALRKTLLGEQLILPSDPNALLFLSNEELSKLTKEQLEEINLKKLKYVNIRLLKRIKEVNKYSLLELRDDVREEVDLLDGGLPSDILELGNLTTSEQIDEWKRVLARFDETQRPIVLHRLRSFSITLWDEIKKLTTAHKVEVIRFAMEMKTMKPELLTRFINQLFELESIAKDFGRLRLNFTTAGQARLERMMGTLQKKLLPESDLDPAILASLRALILKSSQQNAAEQSQAISALEANLTRHIRASEDDLYRNGVTRFSDIESGEWYTTYIHNLEDEGIINGYKDTAGNKLGYFGPSNNVTIAEALKMVLKATNQPISEETPTIDSAMTHWAKNYVRTAEDLEMSIVELPSLDLNKPITREQVIVMILEALGLTAPDYSSSSFSDVTDQNARNAIEYAKELGLISGDDGSTTFRPNGLINRAEISKLLMKVRGEYVLTLE